MTTVVRGQLGDERWLPPRHEAVLVVERRQTREPGRYEPEFVAGVSDVVMPAGGRGLRYAVKEARSAFSSRLNLTP